jgi:hypothetical protein
MHRVKSSTKTVWLNFFLLVLMVFLYSNWTTYMSVTSHHIEQVWKSFLFYIHHYLRKW